MNICSNCGKDHHHQIEDYPVNCHVRMLMECSPEDPLGFPKGAIGIVTGHCDDGRANIFVETNGEGSRTTSHTFHHPEEWLQLIPPAQVKRDREAVKRREREQRRAKEEREIEEFKSGLAQYEPRGPVFDAIWNMAWDQGHSSGLSEVGMYFDELLDLVKIVRKHRPTES